MNTKLHNVVTMVDLPTVASGGRGRPAIDWARTVKEHVRIGTPLIIGLSGENVAMATRHKIAGIMAEISPNLTVTREGSAIVIARHKGRKK